MEDNLSSIEDNLSSDNLKLIRDNLSFIEILNQDVQSLQINRKNNPKYIIKRKKKSVANFLKILRVLILIFNK